jgi:hypothetical protein
VTLAIYPCVRLVDMVQERREPKFPILSGRLTYPLQRTIPARCPRRVLLVAGFLWPVLSFLPFAAAYLSVTHPNQHDLDEIAAITP